MSSTSLSGTRLRTIATSAARRSEPKGTGFPVEAHRGVHVGTSLVPPECDTPPGHFGPREERAQILRRSKGLRPSPPTVRDMLEIARSMQPRDLARIAAKLD